MFWYKNLFAPYWHILHTPTSTTTNADLHNTSIASIYSMLPDMHACGLHMLYIICVRSYSAHNVSTCSSTADADLASPSPPTTAAGKEEAGDAEDQNKTEAGGQETVQSVSGLLFLYSCV